MLMILIFILKKVERPPGDGDNLFSDNGCVNELVLKYAVIKQHFPFLLINNAVVWIVLFIIILKDAETSSAR